MNPLSELLRPHVERHDVSQVTLARRWQERWHALYPDERTRQLSTLQSHMSRVLHDDPTGVRFFFTDRARAHLLLDVLDVPDQERPEIVRVAEAMLAHDGSLPPRLVLDAASLARFDRDAAELLRARFIRDDGSLRLAPAVLLIRTDQLDAVPRSFDLVRDLTIEHFDLNEEAEQRARLLAREPCLVVSARMVAPFERWIAWSGSGLAMEPTSGLESFLASGVTGRLPAVTHTVEEVLAQDPEAAREAVPAFRAPTDGVRLRELVMHLHDEGRVHEHGWTPAWRAAVGRALGMRLPSTSFERHAMELGALTDAMGLDTAAIRHADADAIARMRQRASWAVVEDVAVWADDDRLHLFNPTRPLPPAAVGHPRIVVHRITRRPPALERLLGVLDGWSVADAWIDPALDRALEQARAADAASEAAPDEDAQSFALEHARAALLVSDAVPLAPPRQVADWRDALGELFGMDPPSTSILFVHDEDSPSDIIIKARAADAPRSPYDVAPPRVARTEWRRGAQLEAWRLTIHQAPARSLWDWGTQVGAVVLPFDAELARDVEAWRAMMGASAGAHGESAAFVEQAQHERRRALAREWAERLALVNAHALNMEGMELTAPDWGRLDLIVGLWWLRLRQAMRRDDALRMGDGRVLLRLSDQHIALISVYARATPGAPVAQLVTDLMLQHDGARLIELSVSDWCPDDLPGHMLLASSRCVAEVRIVPSP